MTTPEPARCSFLPWLRRDLATLPRAADGSLPIELLIEDSTSPAQRSVEVDMDLYGPGDVLGLARDQIFRCQPREGAVDFAPNFFPAVEFKSPDLPWLFTPTAAEDGRLQPWLALVVVPHASHPLRQAPDRLPVLEVEPQNLPPASEAWAWAHVQIAEDLAGQPVDRAVLDQGPPTVLSRLICPIRLRTHENYLACVVPTFEAGRTAGIPDCDRGRDPGDPAWGLEKGTVDLPVYFHWTFATGPSGDFETLVRLLRPRPAPPDFGRRPMTVPSPGGPDTLQLESALSVPNPSREDCPLPVRNWLSEEIAPSSEPRLTAPLYGWRYTGRNQLDAGQPVWFRQLNLDPRERAAAAAGACLVRRTQDELIRSAWDIPGDHAAANALIDQVKTVVAIQTAVASHHGSSLPTSRLLRRLAPALPVLHAEGASLERQLDASRIPPALRSGAFRRLTRTGGPLAARSRGPASAPSTAPGDTLFEAIQQGEVATDLPPQATSGTRTRRQLGSRLPKLAAPIWLRLLARCSPILWGALGLVCGLGALGVAPGQPRLAAVLALAAVLLGALAIGTTRLRRHERLEQRLLDPDATHPDRIRATPPRPFFELPGLGSDTAARKPPFWARLFRDSPHATAFREAAIRHQSRWQAARSLAQRPPPAPALEVERYDRQLRTALLPRPPAAARLRTRIRGAGVSFEPDRIWPALKTYPRFTEPLSASLNDDETRSVLLLGAGQLPSNSVTLLAINARFVEAFLVGANHEMARELLWHEHPADLRGTFFQRFWNTGKSHGDAPLPEDIEPIHEWSRTSELGDHLNPAVGRELLIVLIRGELVHRFPDLTLTMQRARWRGNHREPSWDEDGDTQPPVLQGHLGRDTFYRGFALSVDAALGRDGDEGWFFAIKQRPTEPRFGLDDADTDGPPATWNDLSWNHLPPSGDEPDGPRHVRLADSQVAATDSGGLEWGKDAAHMAGITYQRPFLFAVHANEMLPSSGEGDSE